ncbi:CRAL-TRIO domain-containing protein [Scenedesmus sp. NREL 46B-D3]|nr:CRAL-TRIO domain-containing protein [Scenedesmus sp. NREL 46B-D3]
MKHPHHIGTSEELKNALVEAGCWDSYAKQYCDEGCLQRYLRARNMDVTKACAMLKHTLEWRKENKIDDMTTEEFANSRYMRDGWVYVDGNDAEGRSIVVFRKRKERLPVDEHDLYLRYMTFVVETAIRNMKNGQEQWVWMLDLAVYSPSNAPALSVTLGVLQLLANHYPERLHKAYVVNAPSIFQMAWKVLQPFIDTVTRSKAEFVNTKDYHAPVKPAEGTWGAWASSMFHSKSSSKGGAAAAAAAAPGAGGSDAEVVLAGAPADGGKGCFRPFLQTYETPFCYDRQRQLLTACGWK